MYVCHNGIKRNKNKMWQLARAIAEMKPDTEQ